MQLVEIAPLIVSLIYGGIGFAVARSRNGEKFDSRNFTTTAALGTILSAIAAFVNLTPDQVADASVFSVLALLADKAASAFSKKT